MSASTEVTATPAPPEARIDRFHRLLKVWLPERAAHIDRGEWGPTGCPYQFLTLRNGQQRLVLERHELRPVMEQLVEMDDDSDETQVLERITVTGKTRDELLDRLEERLKAHAPAAPGEGPQS
jgi:hypothetical protein